MSTFQLKKILSHFRFDYKLACFSNDYGMPKNEPRKHSHFTKSFKYVSQRKNCL